MLQIFVNDEPLDLFDDTSIELELVNPAFYTEQGSFTYPFDLPHTRRNTRLLGNPAHLDVRSATTSVAGRIFVAGREIPGGTLQLQYPITAKSYRVFIVINGFAEMSRDKTLRDITHLTPQTFANAAAVQTHMGTVLASPAAYEYCFPTIVISEKYGYQNQFTGGFYTVSPLESGASPALYVYNLLKRIFETFGWAWEDNMDAEMRTLILITPREIDKNTASLFELDTKKIAPKVGIGVFIKAYEALFGVKFFFSLKTKTVTTVSLDNLVNQSGAIDWTTKASDDIEITPPVAKGYTLGWNWDTKDTLHSAYLKMHFRLAVRVSGYYVWNNEQVVEDRDALNAIASPTALQTVWVTKEACFYYYQSGWNRLAYTYIGAVTATPGTYAEGDIWLNTTTNRYVLGLRTGGGGTLTATVLAWPQNSDYTTGDGATVQRSDMHTLDLWYFPYGGASRFLPAFFFSEGLFVDPVAAENDTALRVAFYRGYNTGTIGPEPFASPDVYNQAGTTVIGAQSLRWDGQYGLYETRWKNWLAFKSNTKMVSRTLRLHANDVMEVDFSKKYRISNREYLIGKINVSVSTRGVKPAKVEMYTL